MRKKIITLSLIIVLIFSIFIAGVILYYKNNKTFRDFTKIATEDFGKAKVMCDTSGRKNNTVLIYNSPNKDGTKKFFNINASDLWEIRESDDFLNFSQYKYFEADNKWKIDFDNIYGNDKVRVLIGAQVPMDVTSEDIANSKNGSCIGHKSQGNTSTANSTGDYYNDNMFYVSECIDIKNNSTKTDATVSGITTKTGSASEIGYEIGYLMYQINQKGNYNKNNNKYTGGAKSVLEYIIRYYIKATNNYYPIWTDDVELTGTQETILNNAEAYASKVNQYNETPLKVTVGNKATIGSNTYVKVTIENYGYILNSEKNFTNKGTLSIKDEKGNNVPYVTSTNYDNKNYTTSTNYTNLTGKQTIYLKINNSTTVTFSNSFDLLGGRILLLGYGVTKGETGQNISLFSYKKYKLKNSESISIEVGQDLALQKQSNGSNLKVSGIEYKVTNSKGEVVGTFITDANGHSTSSITGLKVGTYTITETKIPDGVSYGYKGCIGSTQKVTISETGGIKTVYFNNTKTLRPLKIVKERWKFRKISKRRNENYNNKW